MSEQPQVTILIQNLLQSENNALRAENQKLLNAMTASKIGELSSVFVNILKTSSDVNVKKFVLTHLRKSLSVFDQSKYEKVWGSITPQNQAYIKESLFDILHKQQSGSVRMICADAIGEIAGSLMKLSPNNWPKFTEFVFILLNDPDPNNIASGLSILECFFSYCPELFSKEVDQFVVIFRKAFVHEKNSVKSAGIKCFANYAFSLDKKRMSKLEPLVLPFYEVAYHLLVNDNQNSDGLDTISEIVETEPHFLKKTFPQLNELVHKIAGIKSLDSGVKKIGAEALLTFAQKYPSLYRQNKELLVRLVELIFVFMIDIDDQIGEEWKSPPEGFDDNADEGDDETINFGMSSVDRLIACVGDKQILPILSNTVQKMIGMDDWRYKYASLMALSQTGEYIEDVTEIKMVVAMLIEFLGDANPMLRYAACHAIGQISDDLSPDYQKAYGYESFIKLAGLLKDKVPRVVSHAASAMTNLLVEMEYNDIKEYMPELVSALLELMTSGISIVKQSAMTTIASVGEMAEHNFIPYFQKTSQVIFSTIQNHHGNHYKELLGLSVEAITAIGESIGKEAFFPVAPHIIEYLINVQDTKLEEVDPQRQYVLAGWQRICSTFGKQMVPYLPRILPNLLQIVENLMKSRVKTSTLESIEDATQGRDGTEKINTFETEEADAAITMLKVFITEIKQLYIPYIQRTTNILLIIVESPINQSLKRVALQCLPLIIKVLKNSGPEWTEFTQVYTKNFINILIKVAIKEYDTDMIGSELEALRKIFDLFNGKFLTAEELNIFSQELIKVLLKSNERKDDTNNLAKEEIEEEEKELLEEEIVMEEEVQVAVSQLIGQLFKTHKEMNAQLVEYIIKDIFPKVFGPGHSYNIYKFGLFLIDDMVEYLGVDIVGKQIWEKFHPVFLQFCSNKNCIVRQASCYGLGVYAEKTPAEMFKPFLEKSLQILIESIQIPQGKEEKENLYLHCKENTIAAFGKIIKSHGSLFDPKPCLKIWLSYLPLKNDKNEALTQHEFLTDILNNNLSLLVQGQTPESAATLLKILQIFGSISQTKYVNDSITNKIKTAMQRIKSLPFFISNYDSFWSKLKESEIIKLTKIVQGL